ncbi:PHB depolymerase family esterase [Franzmannia qiaohouensis]|uniref:PHB depolymerase family esterase n=1 Tax=Franzmannia qiaohouensis TaxID=1329370 RepID=A0ABU1HC35_9GAMM|nr:PHB depolymerase family esterase [Halomonas qiaohouensis]MDR5905015.1 PHB depolymerase family esterase [Halomonas qiaohouensis]
MIDAQRMQEATRLTRAGQLHEAMAILQGAMPDGKSAGSSEHTPDEPYSTGSTFTGTCEVVDEEVSSASAERHSTAEPSGGAAPFSGSRQARQATAASDDIGMASTWRDTWRLLRDPMAKPEQTQRTPQPAQPGAFTAGRFSHPAGTREYKLYLPSGYHGQALPLVVMLHGCTQDPDDFAAGTRMNRLAEEQQFCVLYPAQPMTANSSKCWNWFKAVDQQRDGGEPAILAGMTRQIIDTHALDASRVYVAGLSAGGAMATTLAMTYPDLYAAVGVHSGLPHAVAQSLPDALAAMQGGRPMAATSSAGASTWASTVPAVVFHGDRDATVHPTNADRVAAQYAVSRGASKSVERGQVANGHAYTRTRHHDAGGQLYLEQWVIHGAGHAWSGGDARGSHTDAKGPDAAQEMLRFFNCHQGTV